MARLAGDSTVSPFRVIAPLVSAGFTYTTAQTMIVPAVPQIQAATGSSTSQVAWVVTGYFVSSAALTVLAGRLGDLFGRKMVLIVVLAVFGAGSVVAAMGTSLAAVIVGRVIMGVAGGVFPLAFAIMGQQLPRERAAFGMGLVSSMFGFGGALGLPVGGLIAERFGYTGLFWAAAVMALLSLITIMFLVPKDRGHGTGRIDWLGAILLGVALSSALIAISRIEESGWASPWTLGLFGLGTLALVLLLLVERRVSEPLISPALMRRRNVWVANLVALLITVGQAAAFLLVPQVVQLPRESEVGLGIGVGQAGLFLLPVALGTMVAGTLTGRVIARFGVRPLLTVGGLASGIGLSILAIGGADMTMILVGGVIIGLSGGSVFAVLPVMIADSVPTEHLGTANGVNTIVRHVSMALSAQMVAAVLVLGTPANSLYPSKGAFALDYGSGAVLGLAILLLVPLVSVRPREKAETAATESTSPPTEYVEPTAPRIR